VSKTIENLKNGNYEVVDNQGVSVTQHFIQCLEKEFADLEAKLAEKDEEAQEIYEMYNQERKKNWLYNRKNQDKISFAVEQLNATYRLLNDKAIRITGTGVNAVRLYTINEVFKSQIEELKKEWSRDEYRL
jgi:hypothetical protein